MLLNEKYTVVVILKFAGFGLLVASSFRIALQLI